MAKKKSAAQKAKAQAAAAATQQLEASVGSVDKEEQPGAAPNEHVAASTDPGAVSQESEGAGSVVPESAEDGAAAPAKKKRNRRGKGSRKKKKAAAAVGEGDNDDDETDEEEPEGSKPKVPDATVNSANSPDDDMDSWVEVEQEDAESPLAESVENTKEEAAPPAHIPASIDEGTADEREYLLSGRKIHDPAPDVVESSTGVSLDDLAYSEANQNSGKSSDSGDDAYGDNADDEEEEGGEEEEDEMAEVLELLIEEFAQRHGRLPNEDEIDQWRDAIASSELMSGRGNNQDAAAEEERLDAHEASNDASSSSEASDRGSGENSGDDEFGEDVKPLMSRRLSANQMQMLLNRSDYEDDAQHDNDDDMASEDDSADSDEDRNDDDDSEEDEDYEETSADGSGEVDDVKPLMSRRLSANQLQMLLNRGDYEDDAGESDGSAESNPNQGASGSAPHYDEDDDDGVGAWPNDGAAAKPLPSTLSAAAQRERYAVALTVAAKFKGEGAVGPHLAAALKDLVLVDDPLVMGPVDAFLMAEDFEVLVQQLYAVAVNAASAV